LGFEWLCSSKVVNNILVTHKTISLFVVCIFSQLTFSQVRMSIATDLSVQRSFKVGQRFWALGQNIVVDWHFSSKGTAYGLISYYSVGKFENSLTATAKSSTTTPQQISFTNNAEVRFHQISLGWKQYLIGAFDAEIKWSLYTVTGFGLVFGKAKNSFSTVIDTSLYNPPEYPTSGSGHFKRLTFDLGLGWEIPVSAAAFVYSEGKIWIPTTDYPSKYLLVNDNAPLVAILSVGLRILF
jgi:hypothetical protein